MKKLPFVAVVLCMLGTGCQKSAEKKEQQEFFSKMQFTEDADKQLSMVGLDEIKLDEHAGLQAFVAGDQVTVDGNGSALDLSPPAGGDQVGQVNSVIRGPLSIPATFNEICRGSGFAMKCAGHTVRGIGYISLALPGQDYRVVSGEDEFQIRLPNGSPPIKLNWFDKVEFSGLLQIVDGDRNSSRPIITDASLAVVSAQMTGETLRLGKAIKLFAICNETTLRKFSQEYIENGKDDIASQKLYAVKIDQVAIDNSKLSTGVVISANRGGVYDGACRIVNGEIKKSYVKGTVFTPYSVKENYKKYSDYEYKIWEDRAAREKESEEYKIAAKKEYGKKQAEFSALSEHEKFKLASASIEASLKAIGSFVSTKPEAQTYLEMCNYDLRPAIDNYKRTGRANYMHTAETNCRRKASMLCMPTRDNVACSRYYNAPNVPWSD